MILYARETYKEGYKDILVLDSVNKRKALIQVIMNSRSVYNWAEIIDLSLPVDNTNEVAPGTRKKITRKLKNNVLVRPAYDFLLKHYLRKKQKSEATAILEKIKHLGEADELNLLTQTMVNKTLINLYPKAKINYFEHGLGDYLFIQGIKPLNFNFYCVFADTFKKYLAAQNLKNDYVRNFSDGNNFQDLAHEILEADAEKNKIISAVKVDGKKVLILLDSMEVYQVPDKYWTDYLDLCISKVENPADYTFILKPHHNQAMRSIQISKDHMLGHHKLKTVVIENNLPVNYSIEVLYSFWNDSTDYVFSTFSSGLFYISKLYYNPRVKYYYAYDFFKRYTKNSPVQFLDIYNGIRELVKNVLSENCVDISPK